MATKKLYQDILRDHYLHPRNRGELDEFHYTSGVVNPSCGDSITVQCCIEDGLVARVAFTGSGCMVSQAAASLWTEYVLGKTLAQIAALTIEDSNPLLGITCGPYRARCAFLFIEALQQAISE